MIRGGELDAASEAKGIVEAGDSGLDGIEEEAAVVGLLSWLP